MLITAPLPDEYAFVYDSWAKSFRKSPWAGCVPNSMWPAVSRELSRSLIDRGAVVRVAVTPIEGVPDSRRVAGYSVSEPDQHVLHWLFVKQAFRGLGVGKALLDSTCPDGDWVYTCRTRAAAKFLGPRFTWDTTPARIAQWRH